MSLKMRLYKDVPDYSIFCSEWCIGRIYQTRTGPAGLRWFWALHAPSKPGTMRISNQVANVLAPYWSWTLAYSFHDGRVPTRGQEATIEAAMQAFAKSWHME
jgi:hypothetical protein